MEIRHVIYSWSDCRRGCRRAAGVVVAQRLQGVARLIPILAICLLLLSGCGQKASTGVASTPTTVKDVTADPLAALAAIHELGKTQEERDALLAAYQDLWMKNSDVAEKAAHLQAEIRAKEDEARNAADRARDAQIAQQKIQSRIAIMLFGAGVLLLLAGGAAVAFGWKMPNVPSGKVGAMTAAVGWLFILASPNLDRLGTVLVVTAASVAGLIAASALSMVAHAIWNEWRTKE